MRNFVLILTIKSNFVVFLFPEVSLSKPENVAGSITEALSGATTCKECQVGTFSTGETYLCQPCPADSITLQAGGIFEIVRYRIENRVEFSTIDRIELSYSYD